MRLLMADRTVKKAGGVIHDFIIHDFEVDFKAPIIIGRSFLSIGCALADTERGLIKFRLNSKYTNFNIYRSMTQESDLKLVSVVKHVLECGFEVSITERLGVKALRVVMMNLDGDGVEEYDELVIALERFEFRYKQKRLELDMKNYDSPPIKSSVEEPPKFELKDLPSYMRYVFLGKEITLTVVIVADLKKEIDEPLVSISKCSRGILDGQLRILLGMQQAYKIQLMPDKKPSIERQRRLTPFT